MNATARDMIVLRGVEETSTDSRCGDVTQRWSRHGQRRRVEFDYAPGDRFGRYVITGRLGAGGMGAVYAARDPELSRMVSLKVSKGHASVARERLLREAQRLARLRHDHIVSVFEAGECDGRGFMALQHVAGFDLGVRIERMGPAPVGGRHLDEVASPLRSLVQAGRALAQVHNAGMVHRDFKPANVLVDPSGKAWLTDFGIACDAGTTDDPSEVGLSTLPGETDMEVTCSREDVPMGTPSFMAPEQFAGAVASPAFDQFAFCVALHRLFFGVDPFAGDDVLARRVAAARGRMRRAPRAAHVPRELMALIQRGLAADPGRRFESMHEVVDQLAGFVA